MDELPQDYLDTLKGKIKKDRKQFDNIYSILTEIYPKTLEKEKEKELFESKLIELYNEYTKCKGKKYDNMIAINSSFIALLEKIRKESIQHIKSLKELLNYWNEYPVMLKEVNELVEQLNRKYAEYTQAQKNENKGVDEGPSSLNVGNEFLKNKNEFDVVLMNYEKNRSTDNKYCLMHIILKELEYHSKLAEIYTDAFNEINDINILTDLEKFVEWYPGVQDFDLTKVGLSPVDENKNEESEIIDTSTKNAKKKK